MDFGGIKIWECQYRTLRDEAWSCLPPIVRRGIYVCSADTNCAQRLYPHGTRPFPLWHRRADEHHRERRS